MLSSHPGHGASKRQMYALSCSMHICSPRYSGNSRLVATSQEQYQASSLRYAFPGVQAQLTIPLQSPFSQEQLPHHSSHHDPLYRFLFAAPTRHYLDWNGSIDCSVRLGLSPKPRLLNSRQYWLNCLLPMDVESPEPIRSIPTQRQCLSRRRVGYRRNHH
jgi:hypothetical protein